MLTRHKKYVLLQLFDDYDNTEIDNIKLLNEKLKDILIYINNIFYDIDQFYMIAEICEELIYEYEIIRNKNIEQRNLLQLLKYTYNNFLKRQHLYTLSYYEDVF